MRCLGNRYSFTQIASYILFSSLTEYDFRARYQGLIYNVPLQDFIAAVEAPCSSFGVSISGVCGCFGIVIARALVEVLCWLPALAIAP